MGDMALHLPFYFYFTNEETSWFPKSGLPSMSGFGATEETFYCIPKMTDQT